jgi:hypothetical protein
LRIPKKLTYSTHGPEKIYVGGFIRSDHLSIGRDNLHFKDLIGSEAILSTNRAMTTSCDISAYANIWIHPCHDYAAILGGFGVNISHLMTGRNSQCAEVIGLGV